MLTFTVTRNPKLLSEEDVYAMTPIHSLDELLHAEESLCLVWQPEWEKRSVELYQIRGDQEGQNATVYFACDPASQQSATKSALDRNLLTPYLFCAWKKRGLHTFKLMQKGQTLKEFGTFTEAVAALIPDNFIPQAEYHRKLTVISILGLQLKRANERQELLRRLIKILKDR